MEIRYDENNLCRIQPVSYTHLDVYKRQAEKSGVITDYWTNNLLDLILRKGNLNNAYKQVKKNKGKGGDVYKRQVEN